MSKEARMDPEDDVVIARPLSTEARRQMRVKAAREVLARRSHNPGRSAD